MKTSGKRFLGKLQEEQRSLQTKVSALHDEISTLNRSMEKTDRMIESAKQTICTMRLEYLANARSSSTLTPQERSAQDLLLQRAEKISQHELSITALRNQKHQAISDLEQCIHNEQITQQAAQDARQAHQQFLQAMSAWQTLNGAWQEAHEKSVHAVQKSEQSATQMHAQRAPYEQQHIFPYLWQRKGNFNVIDSWCASLIGFEKAAQNYALLVQIPAHFEQHAQAMQKAAQVALEALQTFEKQTQTPAPVAQTKKAHQMALAAKKDAQQRLKDIEQQLAEALQLQQAYRSAQDDLSKRAHALLFSPLEEHASAWALQSKTQEDDRALHDLQSARAERQQLEQHLQTLLYEHSKEKAQYDKMQKLIKEFTRHKYDASNSTVNMDYLSFITWYSLSESSVSSAIAKIDRVQHFEQPSYSSSGYGSSSSSSSDWGSSSRSSGGFSSGSSFGGGDSGGFSSGDSF